MDNFKDIIDVIGDVVDSMRTTGTYTGVFGSTNTVCTSDNTLNNDEVIVINNVEYKVIDPTASQFKVKGDVSTYTSYKTLAPYYEYGHAKEIADTLSKKDGSTQIIASQKYPLIWLQLDAKADYNQTFNELDYKNLRIYIINFTENKYKAKDRKELNFNPILHPLYESFIGAIRRNEFISQRKNIPNPEHSFTDRYLWGSQFSPSKNIFNDNLDAVDIQNLTISITNNC